MSNTYTHLLAESLCAILITMSTAIITVIVNTSTAAVITL